MHKNNITQKQIAKELGVSISTISRALNDSHQISEQEKKRILTYLQKIKYQPNPHAKSLRSSKTGNIAVLIPDLSNSFFSLALKGIELLIHEKGYNLMIYQTNDNLEIEQNIFRYLENGLVDGVLSAVSMSKKGYVEHVKTLNELMPIVFFDRSLKDENIPHIVCDDYEAGYKATLHLIENGCKYILFIGIDESISVTAERLKGYKAALQFKGLPFSKTNILLCENEEEAQKKIRQTLLKDRAIDGIFSSVERYTMQLYKICNELKITIPQQIKIISFSNNSFVSLMNPALSTVIPPAYEIGREAASVLVQLIEKKKGFQKLDKVIPCTLSFSASSEQQGSL